MMNFAIPGSDNWGCNEFSDSLHNQLFGKISSDSGSNIKATKRKKIKVKKKICKSSELDTGIIKDVHFTKKENRTNKISKQTGGSKIVTKKKAKKMKFDNNESTFEIKSTPSINGKKHANILKSAQCEEISAGRMIKEILPVRTKNKNITVGMRSSTALHANTFCNQPGVSDFCKTKTSKLKKDKRKNTEKPFDPIPNKCRKLGEKSSVSESKSKSLDRVEVKKLSPSKLDRVEVKKLSPSKLHSIFEKYSVYDEVEVQKSDNPKSRSLLLKENAMKCLQAAKFRFLNEKLYTATGSEALEYFRTDPDAFGEYHQGYQSQVMKWPMNPVDLIISDLQKMPKSLAIADLGCGDAKIARIFHNRTVHCFDLVALNDRVTCCDISKLPLRNGSIDIAVFCLSLMGTNLADYIVESHRVLKDGGLLKIAEVESRIEDLDVFIANTEKYGFSLVSKDTKHKMFVFMDFHKVQRKLKKSKLPVIEMNPCMYKKR